MSKSTNRGAVSECRQGDVVTRRTGETHETGTGLRPQGRTGFLRASRSQDILLSRLEISAACHA